MWVKRKAKKTTFIIHFYYFWGFDLVKVGHPICTIITVTLCLPSDSTDQITCIHSTAHSMWSPLFLAIFITFTYQLTAYQILLLISALHTYSPHSPSTAALAAALVPASPSIRTPPLRFHSGTAWAGSGEPAPQLPTVLRGLCCPSSAHWRCSSSSPSLRPLPRNTRARHRPVHTTPATLTSLVLCCWIHARQCCLSPKMRMEWRQKVTWLFWVNEHSRHLKEAKVVEVLFLK